MDEGERMRRAYRVSGRALLEELKARRPDDARVLEGVRPAEVVAIRGSYDRCEQVLEATRVPFVAVDAAESPGIDWARLQVLLVSCPGHLPREALGHIGPWVRGGGYLLTTDWALKHVVEPLFPGTVRHNGRQTTDCVVRVESAAAADDPLLAGFLEAERDPLWWLEGASYPIEVLDPARVRVLVRSREVAQAWGADPVVVTFEEGLGTVVHLMSHLYLQRSDVREARDARPAAEYLASTPLSPDTAASLAAEAGDLRASELRSAGSKSRLLANAILAQKRRQNSRNGPGQ
jgi:hypothetical protein